MPGLGSLVGGIKPIASQKTSDVYITELDDNGKPAGTGIGERRQHTHRFQYFPESVSDNKAINYATKEVPGGSLPLYQWINSGERTIGFTAMFTTDVDHLRNDGGARKGAIQQAQDQFNTSAGAAGGAAGGRGPNTEILTNVGPNSAIKTMYSRLTGSGVLRRNVYIPAALVWLRRFMFPRYSSGQSETGVPFTFPPRKLLLTFPGTAIHLNGGGGTFGQAGGTVCIMTGNDITYDAFFPSGNPRVVSVALTFAQVPQLAGRVAFPRWDQALDNVVETFYGGPFSPGNNG